MRALAALAVLGAALAGPACRAPDAPLYAAGSPSDDGHGELAQASMQLLTAEPSPEPEERRGLRLRPPDPDEDGDAADDADPDAAARSAGGPGYGGASYASYVVPPWRSVAVERKPRYRQVVGLSGAIEGVVSWRGPAPAPLATACGAITLLPLGEGGALADALVYIERVAVGRAIPTEGKPAGVGGVIVKRGCALRPAVQVATPLPSPLIVYGDALGAALRVTPPADAPRTYELGPAGRVALQLGAGVTRLDAADGSFASAWVVGLDTPYYALTDDHGRFRLDELAAGAYEVTVLSPPVPALVGGALAYGPPLVAKRTVRVEAALTARLDVALGR